MRPRQPANACALLLAFSLLVMTGPAIADVGNQQAFSGQALDQQGRLVYSEVHTQTWNGEALLGTATEYADPTGRVIATMVSDYRRSISMPTYEFVDRRSGYREGLRYVDGRYQVYNQEPGQPEASAAIDARSAVFSCQGWHYYLVNNLDLLSQQDIDLRLILPSELDAYRFEVQQARADGNRVEANLVLKNWFFRLFAPKLRLTYDRSIAKLVEYEGISNIVDERGRRQTVRITYDY